MENLIIIFLMGIVDLFANLKLLSIFSKGLRN
jgi:hypothetical protein